MEREGKIKRIKRAIARNIFFVLRWVLSRLPYAVFRLSTFVLVPIGQIFMFEKRKIAMRNLRMALGNEKSEKEIKEIFEGCFDNMGRGMFDLIYYLDRPHLVKDNVEIIGKEHLDKALEAGHGAVILSAHFGLFILMYMRIVAEGYTTNVIMRRTRDEVFEEYISEFRRQRGIHTIYALPQRQCIQQSLKVLRNNELLFTLLDQNYGSGGGVFVDFFGKKAATAAGPVVFASRTKAAIIPMFIRRQPVRSDVGIFNARRDKHVIVIEPPINLEQNEEDQQKALTVNVGKLTKVIEANVRQYPHEWGGWMHERWKTQYRASEKKMETVSS